MASPPRSMFKGVIQFGLVTVGCRLYLAVDPHSTGAHLLHAECLGRIQQKTWCTHCDREITRPETVRGFEIGEGRYVTVTDKPFALQLQNAGVRREAEYELTEAEWPEAFAELQPELAPFV